MFPENDIDGFEKYWRRRKPGRSTALHYASDARIFFRWAHGYRPADISVHEIDWFIEWQQSLGRAGSTIRRRLIALRMFFDYYVYAHDLDIDNPVKPRRHYVDCGERLPRDLSDECLNKLFSAMGKNLRDRTIFTIMLHSGLRVGEITALCTDDILVTESITPRLRVRGKGQKERIVFLSQTAMNLLNAYLDTRPATSDKKVFLNKRGSPISITGIQLQLASYCRKADVWVTCHQFRHTFASKLIANGMPVTSVQKLLGHKSIRTTQRYIQLSDRQVERDYQRSIQMLAPQVLYEEVPHGN
ncbi:MAG: tyrosine-type recombinase/integrase [Anaerolineae bacterium]|jgi:site-specific recombinase XerD|nr:tyrosine-type recombinase/integrase [Anaerolineae bacterium]MBT6060736.1 tyrosine-type recombinase/integrase [Anaerolineae bacterium]MBT6320589.1 tyrosine-type recombinase/integrase [Anaerolineae bacterium]MBT7774506.1 tyrosine-type recombinase/integrase [Anaerolineae bacterium]